MSGPGAGGSLRQDALNREPVLASEEAGWGRSMCPAAGCPG